MPALLATSMKPPKPTTEFSTKRPSERAALAGRSCSTSFTKMIGWFRFDSALLSPLRTGVGVAWW